MRISFWILRSILLEQICLRIAITILFLILIPLATIVALMQKNMRKKWWNGRNPQYKDYGEDADCTNFVSQCLYAGKLAKMSGVLHKGWHHRKYVIPVYTVNKWGMRYWTTVKYFQVSNAWSQAPRLMEWLKDKDHVESEIIITSKAEIKDKIKNLSTKHCTAVIFLKE